MGKIYLPHSEQFDLMNENLAKIANALASNIDLSTWAGIQKAVRVGVAPSLIPVGTQLKVSHSVYGDMMYDVVAHNHFKSAHDKNAHTMTLMCHDVLEKVQFDGREAFYYADHDISAGTYNFTLPEQYGSWAAGTYQFTLTSNLPEGGVLCISDSANIGALNTCEVLAYTSRTDTAPTMTVTISVGNGGTSLGAFGAELNHTQRVSYGSNNYKESAIRQFLNSSSPAGSVWKPQTKFDRPPIWMASLAGFVGGFDEDFLSVVGEVVVPCAANNTYESPDSTTAKGEKYTVTDKFYIASQQEIFNTTTDTVVDGSVLFPYYEGATNTDRIKYKDGSAMGWRMRSAHAWNTQYVRLVNSTGGVVGDMASSGQYAFVPVFTIV